MRRVVGEEVRDVSDVLRLVNHLTQPTNIEPSPLGAFSHIFKMIHGAVGSLFNGLRVAMAGLDGPIAPSLEDGVKALVLASIALLLGLAATNQLTLIRRPPMVALKEPRARSSASRSGKSTKQ
ncbi:hypothetical protein J3458_015151 [Metarhizium acridum]|uniref:uncharacterized protein n=1 Tax=Metarhizium acridum TaxID=92637 RepID=UPI001C6C6E56|nr:hypothetical protein J3458_015151 [Metarhizium acridum]